MKYVYLALNWIFGVIFLLSGLYTLLESLLGGLSLILIALLLLPPVRNFTYSKINKEIPTKVRVIGILILFIAFGIFIGQSQERKAQELAAQEANVKAEKAAALKQQNIDYFNNNSSKILGEIKSAFQGTKYKEVLSLSAKYLPSQNQELIDLNNQAKSKLAAIEKDEKEAKEKAEREANTKEILAKLKNVPSSQFQENKNLYQQLVNYNPGVEQYKEKLDFYSAKIKEKQERERIEQEKIKKEREERIARFGVPPVASAWDGSYYEVERYLKRIANDPDSIDIDGCTKVYHIEDGWLVGCDYRGRNAFGGMIRQSNWFTIVHGTVVQMHDASSYKP